MEFSIPILEVKRLVIQGAREALRLALKDAKQRADDARDAATHEENKPENDKDMRSTEASYIARGIAERVAGLDHALAKLSSMEPALFDDGAPIAISALVETENAGARAVWFLVEEPGGVTVNVQDTRIATLATKSPLGRALLGQSEGDEVTAGPKKVVYEILAVK